LTDVGSTLRGAVTNVEIDHVFGIRPLNANGKRFARMKGKRDQSSGVGRRRFAPDDPGMNFELQ